MAATLVWIKNEIYTILGTKNVIKNNKVFDIIWGIKNTLFDIINAHWRTSFWKSFSKTLQKISIQKIWKFSCRDRGHSFKFDVSRNAAISLLCLFLIVESLSVLDRICIFSSWLFFATPFAIWRCRGCPCGWSVFSCLTKELGHMTNFGQGDVCRSEAVKACAT